MSPGEDEETCPSGTGEESGDIESRPPLNVEVMDQSCVGNGSMPAAMTESVPDIPEANVSGISYVGMTDYIGMTDAEHIEMGIQNYRYRPGQWPHRQKFFDCKTLAGKLIWTATCCNFRYAPGCDDYGHCLWCGYNFSCMANGCCCSCLTPFACCCCPCILVGVANFCDAAQDCSFCQDCPCRSDKPEERA